MGKGNFRAVLGYLAQLLGNRNAALHHYAAAFSKGTDKITPLGGYAQLLADKRDFAGARSVYRRILSLSGNAGRKSALYSYSSRMNIVLTTWKCGELEHAIRLAEALAEQNRTALSLGIQGLLYIEKSKETRDFEPVIRFCEEALAYDADDPVLLDNLGQVLLFAGNMRRSEKYLRKALEKGPDQTDTMGALARVLALTGKTEEASLWNQKALSRKENPYRSLSRDFLLETASLLQPSADRREQEEPK
ncbi:MAG: hypothetical protein II781_02870 [Clostridia bacterium]|nr:hypothetical protein [Clostridia bacterium]